SHAVGASDKPRATHVFNQAFVLSMIVGAAFAVVATLARGPYTAWLGADGETARLGNAYLAWFIPAMALQFFGVAMGSALRGIGIVKPTMLIQVLTVVLNIVLAPVLIFGWGTGHPFGVTGAAIASLISMAVGMVL